MIDFIASNPLTRWITLSALFVVVVSIALLGLAFVNRRLLVRDRLKAIADEGSASHSGSLNTRRDSAWEQLVNRIERAGLSLGDTKVDVLRDTLRAAGYDSPSAPRIYNLIRLVLVVTLPSLFLVIALATQGELSIFRLYLFGSIAGLLGLYLPSLFVRAKADRRREAMVNGFPDSLDLILVCVEAGLGLEAALDRVGKEMTLTHPLVAQLLTTVTLRLRAGANREEALRQMADDSGVSEIRSFSTLLIQSDKLGTSVADTLRVYAAEMRERRRMRAEEKAHRLPVLISIPLVVNMLPVMIGVLMLPAAIRVVRIIIPLLGGG